ncbi:replication fork protection component Swi3-domain-containing protein [Schizothecium vesticola]|uniref:Chromosome segregation in meiosis protein n=1 Tax=Schizothecium vesticola TaxID=314040 RepID=A0AA40F0U7_9PEZI|nr:replication fork protection component Swi3-domain-containing protein [Schizothecium vesticola]
MPATTESNSATDRVATTASFVDDYLADWDDDPFRSPSPEPGAKKKDDNSKKRKEPDTLGIDEQIDLKKPRAPRVKLDEARLLSENGIPKLRKMARKVRLKGKGHEFSDAARLLSFYQEWLDDLFPKATFLDALAMVEKTGHKTVIKTERMKWIDEGKPKSSIEDDDDLFGDREPSAPKEPTRVAPIFEKSGAGRATTPGNDDLFGDDIYGATPRASTTGPSRQVEDVPDEDDLDALMAEAEGSSGPATSIPAFGSIFGGGLAKRPLNPTNEPDDEDMEALLAEAEAQCAPPKPVSVFGNGKAKPATRATGFEGDDEDDMDALMAMADAEAQPVPAKPKAMLVNGKPKSTPRTTGFEDGDDDDMDALTAMAEAEKTVAAKAAAKPTASHPASNGAATKEPTKPVTQDGGDDLDALIAEAEMEAAPPKPSTKKDGPPGENFDAEEEAMAEMEGLW